MIVQPTIPDTNSPLSTPVAAPVITVADAIAAVAAMASLGAARQKALQSSLSALTRMLGLPADNIVLSPSALRTAVLTKGPGAFGLSHSRLKNIRCDLRAICEILGIVDAKAPLTAAWAALLKGLDSRKRAAFAALGRFGSANGIAPGEVDDDVIERFVIWLETRTLTPQPRKLAGAARGAWNRVSTTEPGWPQTKLSLLREKGQYIRPISAFSETFGAGVDLFGARIGPIDLSIVFDEDELGEDEALPTRPARACRQITVEVRQSHIRWAASALVATGVPIEEITSLADLVTPVSRVKAVLKFLVARAGGKASAASMHVAEVLQMIAKYHAGVSAEDLVQIAKWAKACRVPYDGMTLKNQRVVEMMLEDWRFQKYRVLAGALMQSARDLREKDPKLAASLAMRAALIGLLSKHPNRSHNVIGLRLDEHLQRANPPRGLITAIMWPGEDVKNGVPILQKVSEPTGALLEEWITDYRPLIAMPGSPFLFPGENSATNPITRQGMCAAVKATMKQHLGVPLTPQQFRHVSGALMRRAGCSIEEIQYVLGHKDIRTTKRSYLRFDPAVALQRLDDLLEGKAAGVTASSGKKSGEAGKAGGHARWSRRGNGR